CHAGERLHHPTGPQLLDFGTVGAAQRFEARPVAAAAIDRSDDAPGIVIVPRRAVDVIAEMLGQPPGSRPATVAIWAPRGAVKPPVSARLVRTARGRGFVPVAASVLDRFAHRLRGRRLFVIDEHERGGGWTAWLKAAVEAPRSHVLLLVSLEEPCGSRGVAL